jgi:hypothetical protein
MLERETGVEPATSTLARSRSTTELLPLAVSFYSTCALADNSLLPHWHPLFVAPLFCIDHSTPVWQETLDEWGLGVPRLAAVVNVVHHIHMRLACAAQPQECGEPVPQVVKPEPRAILRDHSGSQPQV